MLDAVPAAVAASRRAVGVEEVEPRVEVDLDLDVSLPLLA